MDTRRKNSRIILIIIFILGFIIFTQRDAFGPDAEDGETNVSEQQNP
jgi:hypothetical protein